MVMPNQTKNGANRVALYKSLEAFSGFLAQGAPAGRHRRRPQQRRHQNRVLPRRRTRPSQRPGGCRRPVGLRAGRLDSGRGPGSAGA